MNLIKMMLVMNDESMEKKTMSSEPEARNDRIKS